MSGGVAPTSFDMDVDDVVALLNDYAGGFMTATGSGSTIVEPAIFYLTGGDDQPTVETTVEEVVEMLAEDEEASALIEVSYTGDGGAVVAPMALTELDGGRGPGSISTSAQVGTYLNAQETVAERITVSGGGDNVLRPRQVMAFHGGGAHPQVTTTASALVALLGEDEAAQALVEASGAGSTPLQPLPRTALNRVKGQPPITSTLSEVVAAIQAHPQASALLTATASSGSLGSTVMQAMSRTYLSGSTGRTSYQWTSQDRLAGVTMPDGTQHDYSYDYRARRVGMARRGGSEPARDTAVVFSGGLSVAEYEGVPGFAVSPEAPSVHYVRGPDMGGGVGGMLYSVRGSTVKYSLSNGRGDIIAQSDASAAITWTASYEAYGKRPAETGENLDKQRANSKDEDPTGLLNEGFRYRDLETGMWLSRDPAGFVDGPNLYAYVQQNPWTSFDPNGLQTFFLQPPTWIQPLVKTGLEGAKIVGEGGVRAAPRPAPAPATNFRPSVDPTIIPNPQASAKPVEPTTSQRKTQDDNHKILYIQNNYDEGSSQSNELHEFVGRWNGEIAKNGGSMTTRTPSPLDKAIKRRVQETEREKNPAAYEGKVVGHIPDVVAGGDPSGPLMPLDASVNSSIGAQVQGYHNRSKSSTSGFGGGFRYNEVKVIPKPPPPPPKRVEPPDPSKFAST